MYPRGTTAAATTTVGFEDGGAPRRRDTDASTTYGVLDKLAVFLFNWKLETALNNDAGDSSAAATPPPLPPSGCPRLVALADRIALSRPPAAQLVVVLGTLLGLIPGVVRTLFKMLIKPADLVGRCKLKPVETRVESAWFQRLKLKYDTPVSEFAFKFKLRRYKWVDKMKAVITVEAFAWLVGPCEVVPRDTDGVMAAVKLRKCRYLEQCGCTVGPARYCSQHHSHGPFNSRNEGSTCDRNRESIMILLTMAMGLNTPIAVNISS